VTDGAPETKATAIVSTQMSEEIIVYNVKEGLNVKERQEVEVQPKKTEHCGRIGGEKRGGPRLSLLSIGWLRFEEFQPRGKSWQVLALPKVPGGFAGHLRLEIFEYRSREVVGISGQYIP